VGTGSAPEDLLVSGDLTGQECQVRRRTGTGSTTAPIDV